jgi:hypothetical protein
VNVKEMPGRVQKAPVVKGTFLGWLGNYVIEKPGYFCVVMTHNQGAADSDRSFRVHVMWAAGLDKPWREHETYTHLAIGTASQLVADREKLAVWLKGDK